MSTITKSKTGKQWPLRFCRSVFAVSFIGFALAGCTSSLDLFGNSDKVDRSISTGTVSAGGQPQTSETLSDEATVRNAVTSADITRLSGSSLPWANTATGSAGVISSIQEARSDELICRNFKTSRHSYEGIAMFSGKACRSGDSDWMLTAFERQ